MKYGLRYRVKQRQRSESKVKEMLLRNLGPSKENFFVFNMQLKCLCFASANFEKSFFILFLEFEKEHLCKILVHL